LDHPNLFVRLQAYAGLRNQSRELRVAQLQKIINGQGPAHPYEALYLLPRVSWRHQDRGGQLTQEEFDYLFQMMREYSEDPYLFHYWNIRNGLSDNFEDMVQWVLDADPIVSIKEFKKLLESNPEALSGSEHRIVSFYNDQRVEVLRDHFSSKTEPNETAEQLKREVILFERLLRASDQFRGQNLPLDDIESFLEDFPREFIAPQESTNAQEPSVGGVF
jgi:hypothetical protein